MTVTPVAASNSVKSSGGGGGGGGSLDLVTLLVAGGLVLGVAGRRGPTDTEA